MKTSSLDPPILSPRSGRPAFLLLFALLISAHPVPVTPYEATWESLDSRPLPSWYDEAKFGIFIHWGVFSVPAFGSEWFWQHWEEESGGGKNGRSGDNGYRHFVEATEAKRFSYQQYASRFDATLYRPDVWADAFARSGAQYVVLTSKHHEGYCNWDSRNVQSTWNWNVMDVGPMRDVLADLADAVRRVKSPHTEKALRFGVYHSLFEWFNPTYRRDKENNFTTRDFVDGKTMPELYDLVEKFAPEVIWSDGAWDADSNYWRAKDFLAWLATNSSVADTVVWNDRWGRDCSCKHGSFLTCSDRYQPGKYVAKKWENAMTVDRTSWGFNRNATYSDYLTTEELIHQLIETVAFNGNLLLNVGPSADGTISPIFVDRILGMGEWLGVNGDAIYGTRPWRVCTNETDDSGHGTYYTVGAGGEGSKGPLLYALVKRWPSGNILRLAHPKPSKSTVVSMLGVDDGPPLTWRVSTSGIMQIDLPALTPDKVPCRHAWVFSLSEVSNIAMEGAPPVKANKS